jgi:preprotein translocase subunit SecD
MTPSTKPAAKAAPPVLLLVVALVAGALWLATQQPPRLGLDLKGGTRLTLQAKPTPDVPTVTPPIMESLHAIMERRVNGLGVGEAIIQRAGSDRLLVEIPGIQDPEAAKKQLGRVGLLEFRRFENGQWLPSGVSGKDLSKADVGTDQGGQWLILFELNGPGTEKFGKLTTELGRTQAPLGIFFDGALISAPTVREPILQGSGQITGDFTHESAKAIVDVLNAGALPVNIDILEEATVGPLLGQASLQKSLQAGLVGLGLVAAFMAWVYRRYGLIADVALLIYTLLTYAAFLLLGVTFTLAGIAGFVLSIGMAVDANILIFERIKEELRAGRTRLKAIQAGFDRAFPSIFDSNTSTLLTCAILYWLGTGAVKGFAVTLAVGVLISMFSAISVTRTFLQWFPGPPASPPAPPQPGGGSAARQPPGSASVLAGRAGGTTMVPHLT